MKRVLLLVLACAAGASCAREAPPPVEGDAPVDPGLLEDDGVDTARDPACPASAAYVSSLRARVLDEDGTGIEAAALQLCTAAPDGRTFCLAPSFADASGLVTVDVADSARCMQHTTARVLVPGSTRPAVYCDVPLALDDASVTVAAPFVLVDGRADLDGVTLDVDVAEPERLAARVLSAAEAPTCLRDGLPAGSTLVALAPDEDADAVFALDVTLDDGPVQVWARGALACTQDDGTHLPKDRWTRLDDGLVEGGVATGAVPCLAWLAVVR